MGDELTGQEGQSAAGVLQAATIQGIPLMYVDAEHLEPLAAAAISEEAKARVVQAAQRGYGVLVPERKVIWGEELRTAWWQIDLESGEVVAVGEDGTHQFLVMLAGGVSLFVYVLQMHLIVELIVARRIAWRVGNEWTWDYFWNEAVSGVPTLTPSGEAKSMQQIYQEALNHTKAYMAYTIWPEFLVACEEAANLAFGFIVCPIAWRPRSPRLQASNTNCILKDRAFRRPHGRLAEHGVSSGNWYKKDSEQRSPLISPGALREINSSVKGKVRYEQVAVGNTAWI